MPLEHDPSFVELFVKNQRRIYGYIMTVPTAMRPTICSSRRAWCYGRGPVSFEWMTILCVGGAASPITQSAIGG